MGFWATSLVRCAVLKDNRGRVPVGGQIDGGTRNMVMCWQSVMKFQTVADTIVAPVFRGWGRFRLKWRFPLFLHPSPLYSSEWVMHCNYHIYKPVLLHFHYAASHHSRFCSLIVKHGLSDAELVPVMVSLWSSVRLRLEGRYAPLNCD